MNIVGVEMKITFAVRVDDPASEWWHYTSESWLLFSLTVVHVHKQSLNCPQSLRAYELFWWVTFRGKKHSCEMMHHCFSSFFLHGNMVDMVQINIQQHFKTIIHLEMSPIWSVEKQTLHLELFSKICFLNCHVSLLESSSKLFLITQLQTSI